MYIISGADGPAAVVLIDGERCRPGALFRDDGRNGWDVGVRKAWSDNSPDITQARSSLLVTPFRGWLDTCVDRFHLEFGRSTRWERGTAFNRGSHELRESTGPTT